jgi:pimeloyl-ACP methyl ester carboxylesterase/class 3 adenylate cyclase
MQIPQTKYAQSGEVYIAYQTFGEGPLDIVICPGFVSNVEWYWDEHRAHQWLLSMAKLGRITIFDKRGTGLSDRVGDLPSLDVRMDDLRAVMDAVGIQKASLFGISEGGSLACVFAATFPERCEALILFGCFARFSSWVPTDEAFEGLLNYIKTGWGSGFTGTVSSPSLAEDQAWIRSAGKYERQGGSPAAVVALMKMNQQINISGILSSIQVPTLVIHRTEDKLVSIEGGRELAQGIPGARFFEMPGQDHLPWMEDYPDYMPEIQELLTGERSDHVVDRVLATVMFTDIVDSTVKAEKAGDSVWRGVIEGHNQIVRKQLQKFRGHEIKTMGDGFLVTFDGPARAIKCAKSICEEVKRLGIEIRAGLHTGELEMTENDVRGISVNITARVSALCQGSQVLVTRTVKDLVAGSGIVFNDFGEHVLKGIPDQWQLYSAQ